MFFVEKVDNWYQGYVSQQGLVTWEKFTVDVCKRFGDSVLIDVVEEFNKLKQKGSVNEY